MSRYMRKHGAGSWYTEAFNACVSINHDIGLRDEAGDIASIGSISKKQVEELLKDNVPEDFSKNQEMADFVFFLNRDEYDKQVDIFHQEEDEWIDENYSFDLNCISSSVSPSM